MCIEKAEEEDGNMDMNQPGRQAPSPTFPHGPRLQLKFPDSERVWCSSTVCGSLFHGRWPTNLGR